MATTRSLPLLRRDIFPNGFATRSYQGHPCLSQTQYGSLIRASSSNEGTSRNDYPPPKSSVPSAPGRSTQTRHLFTLSVLFAPSPPAASEPPSSRNSDSKPRQAERRTMSKRSNNINNNNRGNADPELPSFNLSGLGLSKNMKILIYTLIFIFGTIETWVYCQAIWHWWQRRMSLNSESEPRTKE